MYGYHGRILHVNLTNGQTHIETFDETFAQTYLGGNGFAGVQHAAAADTDDPIAAFISCTRDTVADGLNFRFAGNGEGCGVNTVLAQELKQRFSPLNVLAGYDQRAFARALDCGPGPAQGSRAEDDSSCRREFKLHYQPLSSGKIFVNFTLLRGSAIMDATVSRQVA